MTETSTTNLVEYACSNQVATLTLNRPDRLNAFSDDLVRHLADALRRFDLDPDAQVAIICGRGRAFSSGADVHQRQLRKREEFEQHGGPQGWGANSADLFTRSVNWKPVIAAPHGYAMGLALGIVLESDLIVAEAGTKFQVTETSRGLGGSKYWALLNFRGGAAFANEVALTGRFFTAEAGTKFQVTETSRGLGGSKYWALLNFRGGAAFANEVALTGRFFTAEEAFAAGIINRVAPAGQHLEVAHEFAAEVAKNPPLSVRATVRTRRWYMEQVEREVIMQTAPLKLYLSEDFHEAARAFAEKRQPGPFKGR